MTGKLTITITGPAGSGKTRWADHLRAHLPFWDALPKPVIVDGGDAATAERRAAETMREAAVKVADEAVAFGIGIGGKASVAACQGIAAALRRLPSPAPNLQETVTGLPEPVSADEARANANGWMEPVRTAPAGLKAVEEPVASADALHQRLIEVAAELNAGNIPDGVIVTRERKRRPA